MYRLWIMFAEDPTYMQMGKRFQSGSSSGRLWELAFLLMAIAAIVGIVWIWNHYTHARRRWEVESPVSLFRALCRAHQLTWKERQCLNLLVKQQEHAHLATVFVEPRCFDEPNLESFGEQKREQLLAIRQKLFGSSPRVSQ